MRAGIQPALFDSTKRAFLLNSHQYSPLVIVYSGTYRNALLRLEHGTFQWESMPSINDREIRQREDDQNRGTHRMPSDSIFYEKVFPILLIVLGVITAGIIVFAAGVLLRIIPFQ
jgi:hypothetical protein